MDLVCRSANFSSLSFMTRHEAVTILAIMDGKLNGVPFPHSVEMAEVVKNLLLFRQRLRYAENEILQGRKSARLRASKLQKMYQRILELKREMSSMEKERSWTECVKEMPKKRPRRYAVKLANGDVSVDLLNANGTWNTHGRDVVKWMFIPDDVVKEERTRGFVDGGKK